MKFVSSLINCVERFSIFHELTKEQLHSKLDDDGPVNETTVFSDIDVPNPGSRFQSPDDMLGHIMEVRIERKNRTDRGVKPILSMSSSSLLYFYSPIV